NRLTKLLQYLALQYPDEGWDRFLLRDKPKWSQIAVSGHSQGGGNAAMIAKIRLVARVVLFSSVTDSIQTEAPSWVATHVTPVGRVAVPLHGARRGAGGRRSHRDLRRRCAMNATRGTLVRLAVLVTPRIVRIKADGTDETELTTGVGAVDGHPTWSR